MARKQNDVFIGADKLNIEGREIKHLALIKLWATLNLNKTSDTAIGLMGLDLETNHKTAELKLLGFWDGANYTHYYNMNFIDVLFNKIKTCKDEGLSLAYWNKLDPFVIYKQFLNYMNKPKEITLSMEKFGKVSGEWDKEYQEWTIKPVAEVEMTGGLYFGIKNIIRSNIQFFFRNKNGGDLKTVWAYDIAQLYQYGLEQTALGKFDKKTNSYPNKRLKYYSKVDETSHLVDWEKFETDIDYRENIVLKSNRLDSMAVYDLGLQIQDEFYSAFKCYPRTLLSQGSIARAGIVATMTNMYPDDRPKIVADIKSIGIVNYIDPWINKYGETFVKDLLCLSFEAYSGGQIESYMYGYTPTAFTTDLTQAYPYHIQNLWDLRGATISQGVGTPPRTEFSYCFIRGDVSIPDGVDYHPLTIKHPLHKETNIRATGLYRASYTLEERDFIIELGGSFANEEWFNIQTKGEISPLGLVAKVFTDLRALLKPLGKDYIAKISSASLYGILYEAVNTWEEQQTTKTGYHKNTFNYYKDTLTPFKNTFNLLPIVAELKYHYGDDYKKIMARWHKPNSQISPSQVIDELAYQGVHVNSILDSEIIIELEKLYNTETTEYEEYKYIFDGVLKAGYRGGEFLNPIYATVITSKTRIQVSRTANEIKKLGGKVILIMTDSIFFTGRANMVDPATIKQIKTVGYYEPVTEIHDLVCLGSGRYGYKLYNDDTKEWDTMQSKKRGLNAIDIHDPDGIIMGELQADGTYKKEFDWRNALTIMDHSKKDKIQVKVRALISVGMVLNNHAYTYKDLGLIVDELRDVDIIVGKKKRLYDDDIKDPSIMAVQLVQTDPVHIGFGMLGDHKIIDQTLHELRELCMLKTMTTAKDKRKITTSRANKKYRNKNSDKIKTYRTQNYNQLRDYGYERKVSQSMCAWSLEKIKIQLQKDGKL